MNEPLKTSVFAKRIHHQLMPMEVVYEEGFDNEILEGLRKLGHNVTQDVPEIGFTALIAISRVKGFVEAVFDPRRYGSIAIN